MITINVLWLSLMMPWVGLQYVIVVFPDHTHLLFIRHFYKIKSYLKTEINIRKRCRKNVLKIRYLDSMICIAIKLRIRHIIYYQRHSMVLLEKET